MDESERMANSRTGSAVPTAATLATRKLVVLNVVEKESPSRRIRLTDDKEESALMVLALPGHPSMEKGPHAVGRNSISFPEPWKAILVAWDDLEARPRSGSSAGTT